MIILKTNFIRGFSSKVWMIYVFLRVHEQFHFTWLQTKKERNLILRFISQ